MREHVTSLGDQNFCSKFLHESAKKSFGRACIIAPDHWRVCQFLPPRSDVEKLERGAQGPRISDWCTASGSFRSKLLQARAAGRVNLLRLNEHLRNALSANSQDVPMRVFYAAKPAEFEAALVEKGVSFEHPDDDSVQFRVADNDVDVVEKIARRLTIYVYLKDEYVTNAAALGDRYKDSADPE